jgi:uncharacterized membrane-anchored protein YitT (DUF2179 family)
MSKTSNGLVLKVVSARFMVFNATFINILFYILAVIFIGGRNRNKKQTCRKLLTQFITYCCIMYTSPWMGFELKWWYALIAQLSYDSDHDSP